MSKNIIFLKLFKDCDLSEHSEAIRHIVREITVSKSMFKSTIIQLLQSKNNSLKNWIYFKLFKACDMSDCFRHGQFKAIRHVATKIS